MLLPMSLADTLESFIYPPCVLAGLLGGLVTRRWPVAALIGFVLAPLVDYALNQAFSDAHPHFSLGDSLTFAGVGALLALAIWAVARTFRGAVARNKTSA